MSLETYRILLSICMLMETYRILSSICVRVAGEISHIVVHLYVAEDISHIVVHFHVVEDIAKCCPFVCLRRHIAYCRPFVCRRRHIAYCRLFYVAGDITHIVVHRYKYHRRHHTCRRYIAYFRPSVAGDGIRWRVSYKITLYIGLHCRWRHLCATNICKFCSIKWCVKECHFTINSSLCFLNINRYTCRSIVFHDNVCRKSN